MTDHTEELVREAATLGWALASIERFAQSTDERGNTVLLPQYINDIIRQVETSGIDLSLSRGIVGNTGGK